MKALGKHLLIELYGCDAKLLSDTRAIEKILVDGTKHCGATIIDVIFHSFNPYGVSGVIVIAESHLAIHTWPEYGFASLDIYTCGETINPWDAYHFIAKKIKATNMSAIEMRRGILNIPHLKHKQ